MKKGILIVFLLVCVLNVESQDEKIRELEKRIELLETRISELERVLVGELLSEGPVGKSEEISAWRKLRRGMSREEVKRLLGEAENISVSAYAEIWRYERGGFAWFNANGQLDSWDEPVYSWPGP